MVQTSLPVLCWSLLTHQHGNTGNQYGQGETVATGGFLPARSLTNGHCIHIASSSCLTARYLLRGYYVVWFLFLRSPGPFRLLYVTSQMMHFAISPSMSPGGPEWYQQLHRSGSTGSHQQHKSVIISNATTGKFCLNMKTSKSEAAACVSIPVII